MPADRNHLKARRVLIITGSLALVGATFLLDRALVDPGSPFWLNALLAVAGCVHIGGGLGRLGRRVVAVFTNGVRFIDTVPALRRELNAGRVPYNLFGDVHLSTHESRFVGELLAPNWRAADRRIRVATSPCDIRGAGTGSPPARS